MGLVFAGMCAAILYGKVNRTQSHANIMFSNAVCIQYEEEDDEIEEEEEEQMAIMVAVAVGVGVAVVVTLTTTKIAKEHLHQGHR